MVTTGINKLADMMIKKHANEASGYAMQQALEMHERGDTQGEGVWLKVFEEICELQKAACAFRKCIEI